MKNKLFLISILTICTGILIPSFSHAFSDNFDTYEPAKALDGQGLWSDSATTTNPLEVLWTPYAYSANHVIKSYSNGGNITHIDLATSTEGQYNIRYWVPISTTTDSIGVIQTYLGNYPDGLYFNFGYLAPSAKEMVFNGYSTIYCSSTETGQWQYFQMRWSPALIEVNCDQNDWKTISTTTFYGGDFLMGGGGTIPGKIMFVDNLQILSAYQYFSYSGCGEYTTQSTCELHDCEWTQYAQSTTTDGVVIAGNCYGEESSNPWTINTGGILYGTTTTTTIPWIDWNKSSYYDIFKGTIMEYGFAISNAMSYFLANLDPTEGTLDPISLSIPAINGTGTHATTVIMIAFELPIVDQEWIFKILPEDTWHTIRSLLSGTIWIILMFGIKNWLDKFITSIS